MEDKEKDIEVLTPSEIVKRLSRYVIGQDEAKRAVAIAIRNRWRRLRADEGIRKEIIPNNIIMIGPTGVGKTEIARRLSQLVGAPFVKVEATKYTEVGYVGRDVEQIIRDLMEVSVSMVRKEMLSRVKKKAEKKVYDKLLELLFPQVKDSEEETRSRLFEMLHDGKFDDREVEIEVEKVDMPPLFGVMGNIGDMEGLDFQLPEQLQNLLPKSKKLVKMTVKDAKKYLMERESESFIDKEKVKEIAREKAEQNGVVFIDELDKIASKGELSGPDVSRSGVQRDLLPVVEGTTVSTKYGHVKTDHILFIAAGAFQGVSPSDLIPELQGRFPIRVELSSLGAEEFRKILLEPENSLVKQYQALVKSEGVLLHFTRGAIDKIAEYAYMANEKVEDIGARRLHTIMARVLDELLYSLPGKDIEKVTIDAKYVERHLKDYFVDEDLTRYIL